jgi:hypothetical protein
MRVKTGPAHGFETGQTDSALRIMSLGKVSIDLRPNHELAALRALDLLMERVASLVSLHVSLIVLDKGERSEANGALEIVTPLRLGAAVDFRTAIFAQLLVLVMRLCGSELLVKILTKV